MSGQPTSSRLPSRAFLWSFIADVRGGMLQQDALANRGYCRRATDLWRIRVPGFAAALDDAVTVARGRKSRKWRLLDMVTGGMTKAAACEALGVSLNAPFAWARRDPVFADELRIAYERRLLANATATARRLAERIRTHNERVYAAAESIGVSEGTVTRIRRRHPDAWLIVVAALPAVPPKRRSPRVVGVRRGEDERCAA